MDVFVFQLRKNGIEIKKELLGDQPRHLGELLVTSADGIRGSSSKIARLMRESGETVIELLDVQIDAVRGSRMVLKGIERRETNEGTIEYAQSWLCVQAGAPLPMTSRERFFKDSGGDRH